MVGSQQKESTFLHVRNSSAGQSDRQTDTHAYTDTDRLAHPLAEVTSVDKKTVTNTEKYISVCE